MEEQTPVEATPVETNEEVSPEVPAEEPSKVDEPQEVPQAPQAPQEPEDPQVEEEPAEPERPESKRALTRWNKMVEDEVQRRLPQAQQHQGLDYSQALEADPETIQRLETDRKQYGQAQQQTAMQQLESVRWENRLELDAPRIEAMYPQLKKGAPEFDAAVADSLNMHYLNLVGYDATTHTVRNPNLRYADFVEAQFEMAERLANQKVASTTRNIAKQAATTGLRPDGSSSKRLNLDQAPENMSKEELDAKIAHDLKSFTTIR